MQELLFATHNRGKALEIQEIFYNSGFICRFLYNYPSLSQINIQENAQSFEGNALIKAIIIGQKSGMITLADDSGLCVDFLKGEPGVRSARYSEIATDEANNSKLLLHMQGVADMERGCHYHCSVAVYDPIDNYVATTEGVWVGRLAREPRGHKSFGYAPLFLPKDFQYQKSSAELDPEDIIKINHRGKAFGAMLQILLQKY